MKVVASTTTLILLTGIVIAQEQKPLSISAVVALAEKNSIAISLARNGVTVAQQQLRIARMLREPLIGSSLNYGYISNANTWDPSFDHYEQRNIPHHYTQLNLEASALIYKGGRIKNEIVNSRTGVEIAYAMERDVANDTKFAAVSAYLNILQLQNERYVYQQNELLAKRRLETVTRMREQGMVTSNDVLRTELTVSDLQLTASRATNNIQRINNDLAALLGMPPNVQVQPDSSLWQYPMDEVVPDSLLAIAFRKNPRLQLAILSTALAKTNVAISKSDRKPTLSLYANTGLQRPFMNSVPPTDIYFNTWQAGLRLSYNLSSLYQNGKREAAAGLAYSRQQLAQELTAQQLDIRVRNAFIKYQESSNELKVLIKNTQVAGENYRITEQQYNNQLALLTALTEAANIKIEAEVRLANNKIRTIYYFYQLLNEAGIFGDLTFEK